MSRGYVNVGLPAGIVREIREIVKEEDLGYRNISEVVINATRLWLVVLRATKSTGSLLREPTSIRKVA